MPATTAVHVKGLRELNRALRDVSADVRKMDRKVLRSVGEPVAEEAEKLAAAGVRNIGPKWSRFRIGLTSSLLYIAPKQRGTGGRRSDPRARPNLANLLMRKAMEPALALKERLVVERLERALDEIGERNGF